MIKYSSLFCLLALISIHSVTLSDTDSCKFKTVTFDADFSSGGLSSCKQISRYEFDLFIKAEDQPINPSAWYAFKASATMPQSIRVNLKYIEGNHRYQPKVSQDGKHWQLLAHEVAKKNRSAHFTLSLNDKPIWVSAQEIIDNNYYQEWMADTVKKHNLTHYKISQSVEKRDIWAMESRTDTNHWFVIIGRQHPPEITGAMALFPFVETVLSGTELAENFRKKFNILFVPIVNPDGVENGHWRHNVGGVDLNRDWANRSQPEVQGIHNRMQEIVKQGGEIHFALDFHSTQRNLFYTIPVDYGLKQPEFSKIWLTSLDKALPNFDVEIKPGVSKNPGVFKQYFADTYGVHSVTYEAGDRADRNQIKLVARTSAILLMKQMLQ